MTVGDLRGSAKLRDCFGGLPDKILIPDSPLTRAALAESVGRHVKDYTAHPGIEMQKSSM